MSIACHPKKVVKKTCKVIEVSKCWPTTVAHLSRALDFKMNYYKWNGNSKKFYNINPNISPLWHSKLYLCFPKQKTCSYKEFYECTKGVCVKCTMMPSHVMRLYKVNLLQPHFKFFMQKIIRGFWSSRVQVYRLTPIENGLENMQSYLSKEMLNRCNCAVLYSFICFICVLYVLQFYMFHLIGWNFS
jgi:hypothetical protein